MKKVMALLLILAVALSAAACSFSGNMTFETLTNDADPSGSDATSAQTMPVIQVTEAPTLCPPGTFIYNGKDDLWQVTVPDIWKETGVLVEYQRGNTYYTEFAYEEAYEQGAGHVFTIATCLSELEFIDVNELPHGELLYQYQGCQVYVIYPTDVQFGVYEDSSSAAFKKQQEEYSELSSTREDIIDSFIWFG